MHVSRVSFALKQGYINKFLQSLLDFFSQDVMITLMVNTGKLIICHKQFKTIVI